VQIAGVLGGGIAPMIATALLAVGAGNPHYVVLYMVALGIVALICTLLMRPYAENQAVERPVIVHQ
jgi:MHS family shikimate/dehydroshikimate transporter-like MFS transporter